MSNSWVLTTCISQRRTPPQTNCTSTNTISNKLPCTHLQGQPGQGQGNHFQVCIITIDTSSLQKEPSSTKIQGWPGSHSRSYNITHCFLCQASYFQGKPDPRWTSHNSDKIHHIISQLHYYVTLTSFGSTTSDACILLSLRQWQREATELWTT